MRYGTKTHTRVLYTWAYIKPITTFRGRRGTSFVVRNTLEIVLLHIDQTYPN
jgi:hypothetical protein